MAKLGAAERAARGRLTHSAFAIAAPGLEPVLARELQSLGLSAREDAGGASFEAALPGIARANLWSRTASRILVRLGQFRVRALGELARRASALPWEEFLHAGARVRVRATARKSRLYHTGAIAERVLEGMAKCVRVQPVTRSAESDDEDHEALDAQLVLARVDHDVCTLSLDSSGALLHRRGYRQATAKAPMRETLAAAMLAVSDWNPSLGLADPFCGSGTIAIEAAMLARGVAPGANRTFAFERWPGFDSTDWASQRDQATNRIRSAAGPIFASDRDAGAIAAAEANAERAGVRNDIQFTRAALSAAPLGTPGGWIVTNPPYGVRVGERDDLRDLYATLGRLTRERSLTLVMLSADQMLSRHLRLDAETLLATRNGGIPVRVLRAKTAAS